ncbi:hypothetical protein, partial [Paramuribaculum intestinale]|uniref:hypothetical protein n=1 Tax=Paramuribaculum intestinale TaxID=2094151 RepID=UPI00272B206A
TREDGGEVKYNNIYNKTEITAMNLANNLDKLEGFEDITIYKDGKLPSVNIDGKTNDEIAETYRKLYVLLNSNFKNLSSWIENLVSLFNKSIKLTEENEKLIIKKLEYNENPPKNIADETTPTPYYVSSFEELISNYKENIDNISYIVENLYNQFDIKTSNVLSAALIAVYGGLNWYLYKYDAAEKTIKQTPLDKQEFNDEKEALIYMINNNLEAINVLVYAHAQLRRDHENLEQRVDAIKSCNCGGSLEDELIKVADLINETQSKLNARINNTNNQIIDLEKNLRNVEQRQEQLDANHNYKYYLNSYKGSMIGVRLTKPGTQQINNNNNSIESHIQQRHELNRIWEDAPNDRVYSITLHRWYLIDDYNQERFPNGWRRDRNWNAPADYIWDINENEWVHLWYHSSLNANWRTDFYNSSVAITNRKLPTGGGIVWRELEWVWDSTHININFRQWNAPENFVWLLSIQRWVEIDDYNEQTYPPGWRTNRGWHAPNNYIWDRFHGQWIRYA